MNQDAEIIRRLVADHDPAAGFIAADAHADLQGPGDSTTDPRHTYGENRSGRAAIVALRDLAERSVGGDRRDFRLPSGTEGRFRLAGARCDPSPLAYHLPERAPSGRELLLQLAAGAAREPVRTGPDEAYAYVRTAGWYLVTQVRGNQANSKVVASVTESWIAANGFDRRITRRVPGDGTHVNVTAIGPQTGQDAGSGPRRLRLSTVPAVIAHQLDIGHPRSIGPVERFVSLTDLARSQPIPPRAQSAILRVLARSPGLIDSGKVTDRAGRPGVAVSLDSAYSGLPARYTLIFNPDTGSLLGEEETLLGNPGRLNVRPKSVIAYTAFLASDYVASLTARP
jgi:hypothetical protein